MPLNTNANYPSHIFLILFLKKDNSCFSFQARIYLVPEDILRGEVSETLQKIQTTLEVLILFKSTYEDRRANLRQYQKNGSLVRPWDFSPLLIFSGLDRFVNRVKIIKVSMEIRSQHLLEKCQHFWYDS